MKPDQNMSPSAESFLDIRTKLAIFITFLIPSFMFDHPLWHLGLGVLDLVAGLILTRGASLDDKGMVTRFRMRIAIIMADRLSMAMMNRGFGYRNTWTNLHEIRLKRLDLVILLLCLTAILWAVIIRTTTQWALL